jgi:hypothetical protein
MRPGRSGHARDVAGGTQTIGAGARGGTGMTGWRVELWSYRLGVFVLGVLIYRMVDMRGELLLAQMTLVIVICVRLWQRWRTQDGGTAYSPR